MKKLETIIISKEAWKFLKQQDRIKAKCKLLTEEQLEKIWKKIWRNYGANSKDYPIKENEVRINKDTFNQKWNEIKEIIKENGFKYRNDGYIIETIYI